MLQERKRRMTLRRILRHRSGCPGGTTMDLVVGVRAMFCRLPKSKQTEKGFFAGTPAGRPEGSEKPYVIFQFSAISAAELAI